jgi:hypothetical protein
MSQRRKLAFGLGQYSFEEDANKFPSKHCIQAGGNDNWITLGGENRGMSTVGVWISVDHL